MHPDFDVNAFNTRFRAWCKKEHGHESEDDEDPDEEDSDEEDFDEEDSDEEDD